MKVLLYSNNKIDPNYDRPKEIEVEEGTKLGEITLPEGFSFMDPSDTEVGKAGYKEFKLKYTP